MTETGTCARCGTRIPGAGVQGLCPACLARVAFAPETIPVEQPSTGAARTTGAKIHYFGDYELTQEIARGGMGVVYQARQVSLNRVVAVKLLLSGRFASAEFVRRFRTEAEAAASLQHPNIVAIHEIGEHEGQNYFSMDYVAGKSLAELLRQGPMAPSRAVHCLKTIAEAIHYAHQRGILHRDLKPGNIVIDASGQPHVTDFGLARLLEQPDNITQTEAVMGTPSYMPPEQAAGRARQLTTSADVYALGALFYHMLLGRPPFQGATATETLRQVLEAEPKRPRSMNPKLDNDLERICLKCLEKEPQQRYGSAEAVAEDLGRWLRHEPVAAAGPGAGYRFRKFARRHRASFTAAAGMLLLLVAGIVASSWQAVRATRAERRALTQASRSDQVAQFLKDMLEGVGPSVALGRDTRLLREILDKTAERVGRELTNQPTVELELRHTLAAVYGELALYERMEAMAREALGNARSKLGEQNAFVAGAMVQIGEALRHRGRLPEAETFSQEGLALQTRLLGEQRLEVANSLINLALVHRDLGRLPQAEALLQKALKVQQKLLGQENREVAETLNSLGATVREAGRLPEAEDLLRQALTIQRKLPNVQDTVLANSMDSLAGVLYTQGKWPEAETLERDALALLRKFYGNAHPTVANSLNTLGIILCAAGKPAEAEARLREALQIQRTQYINNHPDIANSLNSLAAALVQQQRFADAETVAQEALEMQRQLFGNEHPDVANSLNSLAAIQGSQGKLAEAEASEREAVAIQRKVLGKEHLEVANSLNTLATLLQQQSKLADAEQTQRESLEMRAKTLGEGHPEVAVGMANLAVILRLQNKLTDAENLLRRAVALQRKLLVSTPSEAPAARNNLAMSLRQLALTRLAQEEFVDAEATARECLQLAEQELPDDFQTHHARHLVGASLLGQKEFAKAEPLLVAGFEGMQKQSARTGAASKSALLQAAKRLIQLYELTQQPEKQQAWQGILAELDSSKP